ncbi:prepilin peptidase [Agrilactobacillus yilanensis]|uniref:Prepilin peptidase n=1 Tax=Agrilactobacillus yilanensis TaxID=2485997 RepID=A0ABW4JCZ0_9LACO|nr:A24 family peptidase [Agrilactobacillus yilanensis]
MIYFILFLIGSSTCSFLTCIAQRWPQRSALTGRSCCDTCGKTLKVWQLLPVLGFLIQRGRCYFCKQKIDPVFCLSELICGGVFIELYWLNLTNSLLVVMLIYSWFFILVLLSLMDHFYQFIFPILLLPLLLSGFGLTALPWTAKDLLGLIIFSTSLSVFAYYTHSLGWGDVELLIVITVVFGFKMVTFTLFFGSGLALLVSIHLILQRRFKQQRLAFYPYLSLGLFISYVIL